MPEVRDAPRQSLGYVQYGSIDSATGLGTIPAGARVAYMVAEAQAVRWRDDGTNPTAAIGMLHQVNIPFWFHGDLSGFKIISATAGAKLNVTFYA